MKDYRYYEKYLERHDIRASSQRILMLQYLDESRVHPTAEMIYLDLTRSLPTISKATVYNNLKLFVDRGILKPLNIFKGQVNYDIDGDKHGHFICDNCKSIHDIDVENVSLGLDEQKYHVDNIEIMVRGKCNDCLNKMQN